ncbi:SEC-C domain-containing protein [Beggiatoa alba]|nr:SEC-C domain-containing protein [Beggiatoa alba]
MTASKNRSSDCPCGSNINYSQCCGQYIEQCFLVPTAEALMRSRYSAYVLSDETYLLRTWHASTRPVQLGLEDEAQRWIKLDVLTINQGTPLDNSGTVEFIAHYQVQNKKQKIHEVSRFIKQNTQWFYLDGVLKA